MASLFQNAEQAKVYASFRRPSYPTALFQRIVDSMVDIDKISQPPKNLQVLDVGCGSGQATVALADHYDTIFDQVIGMDPSDSQEQLAHAKSMPPHPKVRYQQGSVPPLPFGGHSLACVTVAQASHWLDLPQFYQEIQRTLQPGGVLAIWCYGLMAFPHQEKLEGLVLKEFYEGTLGEYWDPRRRLVEHLHQDLPSMDEYCPDVSTDRISDPELNMHRDMTAEQLLGYLRSWSGYAKYCHKHGIEHDEEEAYEGDPLYPIEVYLEEHVKKDETIPTVWPVRLLLSVKKHNT
jgi:SAM-dependent methyltransferase